ncbi:ATP-dependent Clp protease proteolytic subunit [Escherichia coli]|nr:ATP-dependent Clp protease proteolytic subunit [Escherichia coli]
MPQRNDRSRSTPTTSPKNNSWFRMQAGHQSDADIYIYDEIGFWGVTAKQFISDLNALGDITHINLHINSPGGDVFEGIAIFNALKTHGASITVYVDGVAASMASVIAMVGNPVIMPENTFMMIHKPFGFTGGDAEDMRTYADLLDKVEAVLLPAYAQKTGKTTDEIAAMLADETWMSGAECLAHGFADQVTPAVKAMACIQSKRTEEFKKMPESIRNMITPPRNSAPRVPDDEPAAPRTPVQAAAPVVDENSIRAQVLAEQKARVNGINDLFAMFGGRYQALQAQCLADPECSLEQAREKLLNEMGRESTPSNKNTPAHIYAGNGNFVGDGIRQALMARAGFEKTERDNVYNGMTLREYARMSLTERGIGVSSYNPMQMVGAAFTHSTSDFGNILLDVANKAILQGWEDAPETYEQWTRKGQLSDFKIAHRVGMGGFSALRQVREGAEYKYVTTGDKQATIALATYGELFSITRQAIINDDLNMLTDVPMKLGRAAKSTIADLVYAILTSNPKISTDNVSLFDKAKHANVLESAAMDVASLDKARQLMRVQKEGERHLNIRPAFVLVTATPHLAVYDPTVQFEFWFSEKRITDIRQVETSARYLGTALYWIAASINIRPGHDYYFYVRSVNTVGKSAFVEAVGRASDDAEGYLDFFKGKITESHLGKELLEKVELTENNASKLEEFSKEWKDANDKWNAMWGVKIEQTKDGKHYVAGIGLSMEDTEEGKLSQFLVAANRIAFIDPSNGNTRPMFVGQGDQIFMNDVFLKRLTAPTITSGGSPPVFSLTSDGKLTAKNADISGSVNANSGTLNNVTINENCQIKGKLSANQIEGDIVKTVSKSFPRTSTYASGTITVRISDDQKFDRQVMIPPVLFRGGKHENFNSNNQQSYWYSTCRLRVTRNGQEIFNQSTTDAQGVFSSVIDMPAGQGTLTLTFTVSSSGANNWTPTTSISDLLVVVMKKSTAGISIS